MSQTAHSPKTTDHLPFSQDDPRCQRVLHSAQRLFAEQPDWVVFYRRILGTGGVARREFPNDQDLYQFEQTAAFAEIQQLLARLRESQPTLADEQEPTRVITVRLPKSLHEALRVEAYQHCTSMNKLCISKLLQFIEHELVPNEPFRLGGSRKTPRRRPPRRRERKEEE